MGFVNSIQSRQITYDQLLIEASILPTNQYMPLVKWLNHHQAPKGINALGQFRYIVQDDQCNVQAEITAHHGQPGQFIQTVQTGTTISWSLNANTVKWPATTNVMYSIVGGFEEFAVMDALEQLKQFAMYDNDTWRYAPDSALSRAVRGLQRV